jgi:GH24 family phage-related lysozyme (muramidase)
LIALTSSSEGVRLAPYNDAIGAHVQTVCFGETNVPMRRYSLAECKQILSTSLAGYAQAVHDSTPGFDTLSDGQKIAAVDYAYNRGVGAWRSTSTADGPDIRSAYAGRNFPAACDMFAQWAKVKRKGKWFECSVRANGCYGIYTRRLAERAACLGE